MHEENVHNLTAPREVVPIIMSIVKPKSVLDVGCGIGTWLKVFEEHGVTDYLGVDGNYVNRNLLKIPQSNFFPFDLTNELVLRKKFDLVISLEVAEHIPEKSADLFVKSLALHSDIILFSAAVPGQGGQNHLNEQWPKYWEKKFERHGFYFHDIVRPLIWENNKVDWWYRQNIFLLTKKFSDTPIHASIHPDCFAQLVERVRKCDNQSSASEEIGVYHSLLRLMRSIRKSTLRTIK